MLKNEVSSLTDFSKKFEESVKKLSDELAAIRESSQKEIDLQKTEIESLAKNLYYYYY
jgi:phage host-nuclease inhibitor protein Gam